MALFTTDDSVEEPVDVDGPLQWSRKSTAASPNGICRKDGVT
jgi:hypothetical protein